MLAAPPFGASSNIALWRAYNKPPVELVVADLTPFTEAALKKSVRDSYSFDRPVISGAIAE
jgi:hypothetical protein